MDKPKRVEKYGARVWQNEQTDNLRKEQCLCFHCKRMIDNCKQSHVLFAMCQAFNLALMVTRCPDWEANTND